MAKLPKKCVLYIGTGIYYSEIALLVNIVIYHIIDPHYPLNLHDVMWHVCHYQT